MNNEAWLPQIALDTFLENSRMIGRLPFTGAQELLCKGFIYHIFQIYKLKGKKLNED